MSYGLRFNQMSRHIVGIFGDFRFQEVYAEVRCFGTHADVRWLKFFADVDSFEVYADVR